MTKKIIISLYGTTEAEITLDKVEEEIREQIDQIREQLAKKEIIISTVKVEDES